MRLARDPLPGPLPGGDFKSIDAHLRALDKHLTLRSYIDGYVLGDVDTKTWVALRNNRAALGFIRKGSLGNLSRWFTFIEKNHPEIQEEIKQAEAVKAAKQAAAGKAGGSYNITLPDAEKGVVTRFLPEPSGYLHIGHAKAALLCDYFAHRLYDGKLRLRLDDTNPAKESRLSLYTSDYFDYLYDMCKRLISEGNAYADDTETETMQKERFDGIESKRRNRSVEENLRIFEEMKAGSEEGLKNCIRAKLSVDNPNKALRDPVVYRCNPNDTHHRTGNKWKIYPTYDFACPVVDAHEGITHALRATEYTDRNPQYQWFLDTLKLRTVHLWDFSRLNFIKTFLSKRKLAKLVETGKVWGWDDPRMPTIRGIRRRGMTIPALRDFIIKQGPSRNISLQDWKSFWATNIKEIDPVAPRHTAVLKKDLVKVTLIGNEAPAQPSKEDKPKHAKNPDIGTKKVVYSSQVILDQADAKSFKKDEEITLMSWGNAFVREIDSSDPIQTLTCELNLKGDFKTTEKKITWLSSEGTELVPAELWEFDYLITKDKLEADDELEKCLNPVTESMQEALCDEGVGLLKTDDIIQLERRGFFRVDKGLGDWEEGEPKRVVLFAIPSGKGK
ncbi:unnamed protein product [Parascedosporium putredinis]|uniref:glutamate--tRNA ligase n=1 Tax=Parascedosporium putredinis TaxID=1442378 RepID=A0A9P1GUF8_9PEZI|nr:unnamed protein product [Parascedosporium putredinis]CAI7987585.1 unnamed protein product [Parascedosporium putredinis]